MTLDVISDAVAGDAEVSVETIVVISDAMVAEAVVPVEFSKTTATINC